MPGSTTDVLNEDIKELKAEIEGLEGEFRRNLDTLREDIHQLAVGIAELRGELKVVLGIAKWARALRVSTIIAVASTGLWWGSKLTNRVDSLETRLDKSESRLEQVPQAPPAVPKARESDQPPKP